LGESHESQHDRIVESLLKQIRSTNHMSNIDNIQPRLVQYPSRDGSEQGPLVSFPGEKDLPESAFHEACAQAWPQLLQEFVGNNYGPHEDHGYIDQMVKHILDGTVDQAKQYAQGWQNGRKAS
jgi:hypothetical protein